MTGANPESIPGGVNKGSPAVEENNPVDLQSIPRSALGVVSQSGEILDQAGNTVGKISDSKNPQELVGNTVNAGGDVVNSTGEVLGKAALNNNENQGGNDEEGSEYTTKEVEGDNNSSGFNLLNRTKGMGKYIGLGGSQKSQQDDASEFSQPQSQGESLGAEQKVQDQKDNSESQDAPQDTPDISLEDREDTAKQGEEAVDDNVNKTGEEAGDVTKDAEEKTEDAKKDAEDQGVDTEKLGEDGQENVTKEGEKLPEGEEKLGENGEKLGEEGEKLGENGEKLGEEGEKLGEEGEKLGEEGEKLGEEGEKLGEDGEKLPEGEKLAEGQEAVEGEKPAEGEQAEGEKAEGEEEDDGDKLDFSALKGTKVNKAGNLVNDEGEVIGKIIEGDRKQLLGKKCDENGDIWDDSGKKVGKAEPLRNADREDLKKTFAPFENFPEATVEADGSVVSDGRRVGTVVDGDPKRLKGSKVDEDGDILDRNGNVVGKAEAWDEPEPEPEAEPEKVDNSALAGKRVNKAGNVVSQSGEIYGRVVEGNVSSMVGRMCDKDGNIRSESGDVIGRAELVPEGEREGSKEGPFAELKGCTVAKDGTIVTPSGDIVGRLTSGDGKSLYGRAVDEDGDVVDRNGNVLAKAERWEPEEVEKKRGPMSGRKVNRDGNVLDDDGNIMGKLVQGDPLVCAGKEADDDGDVVNSKGQTIGHVVLIEDVPPEPEAEESAEDKEKREKALKDKELAGQLSSCIEQSLDKIRPICKMITEKIDRAERTPKEELDEEDLVKQVKPLIEEGNKILTETNGVIRGLDPDGRIQRNAKHKANTREATPEEFHLADVLKELTGNVTECVDNAKRKIEDMPHAKKELNPLWGLLTEPLFQIIAAVGLLLNGVLGIVGRLLSGLGLGNLVEGLLGGLGLDKILDGLGLGSVMGSITGKK